MKTISAAIIGIIAASQTLATVPDTSFCVEADGRVYDVVTRLADAQVYGTTAGVRESSRLVFVACSAESAAIWIPNGDRPNSRVSAQDILIDAATSDESISMRTLQDRLEDNGFETTLQGYRAGGCLCDPETLEQAFVPKELKDKLIEEDQK